MATSPESHPELYKSVIIGGVPSPGTVTLHGYERGQEVNEARVCGATGAVQPSKGTKLSKFEAAFYLADLDDVADWDNFVAMLNAAAEAPKPKALSVYHPDLARNKITDCLVAEIGIMQYDGTGGATVECKFIEFKPVKARPVATGEAKRKASTANDPNAARKKELADLLEQAKHPR